MSDIEFVPLAEKHLALLHQWVHISHVKKWYARDVSYTPEMIEDKYLPKIKDNKNILNYIVTLGGHPIGYIQLYNLEHSLPDEVDSYLLTYTLIQETRITRRSTIWRYENETWKIAYHQGTIVEDIL